ncbi:MAG TPA: sugar transferase [Nevskiaceae bacterium]|nr:sugar transferase [Nevskiaceae bacterium]
MANPGKEYLASSERRFLDISGAVVLLGALALPTAGASLFLARQADWRNPFIAQERIDAQGNRTTIIKLRTLHPSAEQGPVEIQGVEDSRKLPGAGPVRNLGLDEAPQLLRVVQGTDALVGPRPELLENLEGMYGADPKLFDELHAMYTELKVKCGMTGPSQLLRRELQHLPYDERILAASMRADMDFYPKATLEHDLAVLALTPYVVLHERGEQP